MKTYCNPLDLPYRYQHMNEQGRRYAFREGADRRWFCSREPITCLSRCRRAFSIRMICSAGASTPTPT